MKKNDSVPAQPVSAGHTSHWLLPLLRKSWPLQIFLPLWFMQTSCSHTSYTTMGNIEVIDRSLAQLIDTSAEPVVIADGFDWCEGPVWVEKEQMLLVSDVPGNSIYKWTAAKGKELYLQPSGYTGTAPRKGELGSNGLVLDLQGRLVICQDGDRRLARMDAPLNAPAAKFTPLAGTYDSRKFNSPNDLVYESNGDILFTDPPYGLERNMDDSLKELPYQGVFRIRTSGLVQLLTDSITRPNGIALMPGGGTVIIANSDPLRPVWYAYDIDSAGAFIHPRIFCDAMEATKSAKGMPDGLKIDRQGNVFATGPGGVWIFNRDGKLLGKIRIPGLASNCAFSGDEKTLYITADDYVLRLKLKG